MYTLLANAAIMPRMDKSSPENSSIATSTSLIVESLTRAIVANRLPPGAKLVEQKLADQFGVSRTLVRQALYQLAQNRLIQLEPARGAFVAAPSAEEARQVFAVRRMLESGMVRSLIAVAGPNHIAQLRDHVEKEAAAVRGGDVPSRTALLGDFHTAMAGLLDNAVLSDMLRDLVSRCTLITLMYQSEAEAEHSYEEHSGIVDAIEAGNTDLALRLMDEHLHHVEEGLTLQADA